MAKIVGVHIPEGIKNYIINADPRIAQRGTSFAAAANATYFCDRWSYGKNATGAVHTASQDTDVPSFAQSGYAFQNSLRINLTTPDTSIGASEFVILQQRIEGYNWANLSQKQFTVSFWVKATLPGVYCLALGNAGGDRAYTAEYTISGANTWEYKVLVIPPSPVAGTWDYTNGTGLQVMWTIACGTTFQGTAGSWQSGQFFCTSNQVNGVNTGATDFRLTGIMVNEGPSAFPFRLFAGDFEGELAACQRYYEKSYNWNVNPGTATQTGETRIVVASSMGTGNQKVFGSNKFAVAKRATPTTTVFYASATGTANSATNFSTGSSDFGCATNNQSSQNCSIITNTGGTISSGDSIGWQWATEAEIP